MKKQTPESNSILFAGNENQQLTKELRKVGDVALHDGSQDILTSDMVFVTDEKALNPEDYAKVIDAGKTLALIDVTEVQAKKLVEVVKAGEPRACKFMVITKKITPQGHTRCIINRIPNAGDIKTNTFKKDEQTGKIEKLEITSPPYTNVEKMIADEINVHLEKVRHDEPDPLVPPVGSQFGIVTFVDRRHHTFTPVFLRDIHPGCQPQEVAAHVISNFYVYHENAYGSNDYAVILVQKGEFLPGELTWSKDDYEMEFCTMWLTMGMIPLDENFSPFSSGVDLFATSPQDLRGNDHVTACIEEPLNLLTRTGGSCEPERWIAKNTPNPCGIKNWGIGNLSNPDANMPTWHYYLDLPGVDPAWNNPYEHHNMPGYWSNFTNLKKDQMPLLCTEPFNYELISAFRFDKDLVSHGKLIVNFHSSFPGEEHTVWKHCSAGQYWAAGPQDYAEAIFLYSKKLSLTEIAKRTPKTCP
jgi:hypothetical protein